LGWVTRNGPMDNSAAALYHFRPCCLCVTGSVFRMLRYLYFYTLQHAVEYVPHGWCFVYRRFILSI